MKRSPHYLFLVILLLAFSFYLLAKKSSAFFVGFGAVGGTEQVIKKGQEQGLIPSSLPPSNLQAAAASSTQISLSWKDNSSNELGFKIERRTGNGGFTEIASVTTNITVFNNTGLDPGKTYYYRVRAYNAEGASDYSNEASAATMSNIPNSPSAPAGPDTGSAGIAYTYSTSAIDSEGGNVKYGWDWNGDGIADEWSDFGLSGWTDIRQHAWASSGTYNVRARTQNSGLGVSSWSDTKTVTITNNPPSKPSVPSGALSGLAGVAYIYSSSAADPEGDQVKYGWDWDGNGTVDEWSSFINSGLSDARSHTWMNSGVYSIKTVAQDYYSGISAWSDSHTVEIVNNPPSMPSVSGPDTGIAGPNTGPYTALSADPEGSMIKYGWDWDADGTADEWSGFFNSGTADTRTHTWLNTGTYNVRVIARDSYDALSSWSDTKTILIINNPPDTPSAPSGPDTAVIEHSAAYSVSGSDPDGHRVRYGWDWDGDGTADEWSDYGASGWADVRSHAWANTGNCYVRVIAQDLYNAFSAWSDTKTVLMINNPPDTPSAPGGSSSVEIDAAGTFSCSAIDPDSHEIRYGWDWDNNNVVDEWSGYGASGWTDSRAHAWPGVGAFAVKVKARDYYGLESGWSNTTTVMVTPATVWQKSTYVEGGNYGIAVDDTGNVYVIGMCNRGSNYEYITIKYNSNGDTIWKVFCEDGGMAIGSGIAVDAAGFVYVTGAVSNANYDALTIKYDPNGDVVWKKTYSGIGQDRGAGIAVDASGNVYVTGYSSNGSNIDILTIKYDSDGGVVWSKMYNGGSDDKGYGIAVDAAGNVYVTGNYHNTKNTDYITIKYDSAGNTVWQKVRDGGSWDEAYAVALDVDGNAYVTGFSSAGGYYACLTIKYSSAGDSIWQNAWSFGAGCNNRGRGITVDDTGNVYVGGYFNLGAGVENSFMLKYNFVGNPAWQKAYSDATYDYCYGIAVDAPGNIYTTGYYSIGASSFSLATRYRQY